MENAEHDEGQSEENIKKRKVPPFNATFSSSPDLRYIEARFERKCVQTYLEKSQGLATNRISLMWIWTSMMVCGLLDSVASILLCAVTTYAAVYAVVRAVDLV